MGVKFGPEFERIIAQIFAMQLDGKIKSHSQLMKEMRELAGIKEPPPPPPAPPVSIPKKGKGKYSEVAPAHPYQKGTHAGPVPAPPPATKVKAAAPAAPKALPQAAPVRIGARWGQAKSDVKKAPAKAVMAPQHFAKATTAKKETQETVKGITAGKIC